MNTFRSFPIPSLEATLNVVWETIKAYMPDNSPCMELKKRKNGAAENNEKSWFRQEGNAGENTEMATMAEGGQEATGEFFELRVLSYESHIFGLKIFLVTSSNKNRLNFACLIQLYIELGRMLQVSPKTGSLAGNKVISSREVDPAWLQSTFQKEIFARVEVPKVIKSMSGKLLGT